MFYRLHVRTRRRLGVPVQPLRYFRLLWRRVLQPGLGTVLIAELDGAPVAAGVFLASRGTCVYKYGASDERRWSARPNHLLFWEAIRWAAARGCRHVRLRAHRPRRRRPAGVQGALGHRGGTLKYSVLADDPGRPGRTGTGLPAPLRSVIRHGPRAFRVRVGELLYRYTA